MRRILVFQLVGVMLELNAKRCVFSIYKSHFRFHLKKGTMNVHTLLQKMFQNELTDETHPDLSSMVTAEASDAPKFEQFTQS